MTYTFPKATAEDLKRLTSKSIKDSYKRVTWTNPEDNKVYHILEEGRKGGKVQVRILDKDGEFLKNAELEPKTIMILDEFVSIRGVAHGRIMETLAKRFNPFANVERMNHKHGLIEYLKYKRDLPLSLEVKRYEELAKKMDKGKKVDYISVSEAYMVDINEVLGKNGQTQRDYVAKSGTIRVLGPVVKKIMEKGTRILESAGNNFRYANRSVSDELEIEGIEGVGALRKGKIAQDSCSRNSVFTQHYEKRDFPATLTKDENGKVLGLNISGLTGTDLPLNWKTKHLIGANLGGTS